MTDRLLNKRVLSTAAALKVVIVLTWLICAEKAFLLIVYVCPIEKKKLAENYQTEHHLLIACLRNRFGK